MGKDCGSKVDSCTEETREKKEKERKEQEAKVPAELKKGEGCCG